MQILVVGVLVILILIAIGIYFSSSGDRGLVEERLQRYLEEDDTSKDDKKDKSSSAVSDWVNRSVERYSWGDELAKSLARADLKFKPGEYVALIVILAISLGAVAWVAGGRQILSFIIGAVFGVVLPIAYVRSQQGKRLTRFNSQLPDMLNLMVNGLRAGYSTMQAMEAVSKELPSPISDEFRRVVQEMQLGIPMDRALDNLLRRIPSEDLDFFVTAINVQREVGGPLADILDSISYTIRERVRIKGEIKVLTAQVVMSGRILSGVPFAVFILLWFINQDYMGEFFKAPFLCGIGPLILGVVMIAIGYFIMTRIADIQV